MNDAGRLSRTLLAFAALMAWAVTGASLPASPLATHPTVRLSAPAPVLAQTAPGEPVLRVADDLGTRLDLIVPPGASRVVIKPCADAPDGDFGWVCAYDAQGREILRQKETTGIVFRLEERGTLVARLGEQSDAPVEVKVPAGTHRIHLVSQNFDEDSNPRKDGRVLAYDAAGGVVADESGLSLDILTP